MYMYTTQHGLYYHCKLMQFANENQLVVLTQTHSPLPPALSVLEEAWPVAVLAMQPEVDM